MDCVRDGRARSAPHGNPLTMAAARASLQEVLRRTYARLDALTDG